MCKINNKSIIIIIALFVSFCVSLAINIWQCNTTDNDLSILSDAEYVTIALPYEVSASDADEAKELNDFYANLVSSFYDNNIDSFNDLIYNERMQWITLSSEYSICASSYTYPSDVAENTYIKNGKLIEVSSETEPPEVETGLHATLFCEGNPGFRESVTREGILEHIEWSAVDVDYINSCYDSIYDELAWTVELYQNESGSAGWVIYKLSNDTYLITNGVSSFSEETYTREFTGKVFVVKRLNDGVYDNELKIVAFIDVI